VLSTLLLGLLLRKKARLGIWQSYQRLWDAVLYLVAGPVVFYGSLAAFIFAETAILAVKQVNPESPVRLYTYGGVALFSFLALILGPVVYVTRAIRRFYESPFLLAFLMVGLMWFCSVFFVVIPLNTISENSLSEDEHRIVDDLRITSFAEGTYLLRGESCGSVADLKEYAKTFVVGDPTFGGGPLFAWVRLRSDDFREEMHGYRITIGRNSRHCEIEAVPIKYEAGTRLSFFTDPGGALIYADNKEGAFAKPWDKILWRPLRFIIALIAYGGGRPGPLS